MKQKNRDAIDETLDKVHFVGKNRFYMDETPEDAELDAALNHAIDTELTKAALSADNYSMDLPKLTQAQRDLLIVEVIKNLLREKGVTDEELNEIDKYADAELQKLMQEHKDHVNAFTVYNGKGITDPTDTEPGTK